MFSFWVKKVVFIFMKEIVFEMDLQRMLVVFWEVLFELLSFLIGFEFNFFEVGGYFLLVVEMCEVIECDFGVVFEVVDVFESLMI